MVNFILLSNSVVLNFNGETHTIAKEDKRYAEIERALKEERLDDIPELVKMNTRDFEDVDNGLTFRDNTIYINNTPIPEELAQRIINHKEQGLPYKYLALFAEKLRKNPSYNSRMSLFKFLEHNGHPITKDGNFIAYRGVRSDFKDCHSGTFDNSPGKVCEMPRESVDDNPNNTCSRGLHVACWDYAKTFGPTKIEVEVDPADVVCVPTDYNGTKMRVCKFKVLNVCQNMRNESLYDYDNWDDSDEEDIWGDGDDDGDDWNF